MLDTTDNFSLLNVIYKGGIVMVPLLFCSLLALGIIIERLVWGPNRKRVLPESFLREVDELIRANRFEELVGICRAKSSPLARLIHTALRMANRPRAEIIEGLEMVGRREARELQKYNGILGTIAAVSPLLGLLGTVFGMIKTFAVIRGSGVGDPQAMSGGIAEALITTAAGLVIAVPSLVFYRYFLHRSKGLVMEMEEVSMGVVDAITSRPKLEDIIVGDLESKRAGLK